MNEKVKMIFGCFFISVIFIILGLNGTPGTKAGVASMVFTFMGVVAFFCGVGTLISTAVNSIRKKK